MKSVQYRVKNRIEDMVEKKLWSMVQERRRVGVGNRVWGVLGISMWTRIRRGVADQVYVRIQNTIQELFL